MRRLRQFLVVLVCPALTVTAPMDGSAAPVIAGVETTPPRDNPVFNVGDAVEFAGSCPDAPDGSTATIRYDVYNDMFINGYVVPPTTLEAEVQNGSFSTVYTIPNEAISARTLPGGRRHSWMHFDASCPTGPLIPAVGTVLAGRFRVAHLLPRGENEPYTPLPTPVRALDSRPATTVGGYSTPWPADGVRVVQVAGGSGVPVGATVAVVNITVTNPISNGFLTAFRAGDPAPAVSTTNFRAGETRSANAWVRLDDLGRMAIYTQVATDVIVDVLGYTGGDGRANGRGSGLLSVEPTRMLDEGLTAGQSRSIRVDPGPFINRVPTAAVVNITVEAGTRPGYVTASSATSPPLGTTSTVNFAASDTVSNLTVVPVDPATQSISVRTLVDARVVVDVQGYFLPSPFGAYFETYTAAEPQRIVGGTWESDPASERFSSGDDRRVGLTDTLQLWKPPPFTTILVNVTLADPTADTYLTLTATKNTSTTSNLNAVADAAQSNHTLIVPNDDGTANVHLQQGASHVLIDVEGFFS